MSAGLVRAAATSVVTRPRPISMASDAEGWRPFTKIRRREMRTAETPMLQTKALAPNRH